MNQESRKIKSFTDLVTWREGHDLVLSVYNITKNFPKEEQFGLVNQLRRAAGFFYFKRCRRFQSAFLQGKSAILFNSARFSY